MTTWTFGGTPFSTYGIVTLINDYMDVPERRGDNILIPFRHGRTFVQKYYEERTLVFGIGVNTASAAALEAAIDVLKADFAPSTEQTLAMTMEDATVRNVQATVNRPIEIQRKSARLALVVVSFELAFPFWRLSTAIADNTTTIDASPKAMAVTNPGTVEERDPTIILTGPLTDVTITNSTLSTTLTYTGVISAGHTVTIGTSSGEYYATHSVSGDVIGNISHAGSSSLLPLAVGSNSLSITSTVTTTGTVKVTFYAPYL
jgi:phage-related protein